MSDLEFLGPYRIESKLGQGGMGTVYRGVHKDTGQPVAIKLLANEMAREPRFRNRFASEIKTLEKLSHPNIVRLIAWPKDLDDPEKREHYKGPLFYSMELVEGPSLLEHLRKVKRLYWDETIGYAIEICSALKHAHDMGVIHRDLKPANLLLEPEGRIKLTDFGIAKLFGAAEQTVAGSVLGTADYMAPEQASGGPINARTDLYALGSLMYACLAGRPPFGGRDLTRVLHGLKHETPPPLDLVLPDVPPELAELVHELLEKKPEDRPPTALVVGKRLKTLRAGLRRRGDKPRFDTESRTMPDASSGKTSVNPGDRGAARQAGADEPTAYELDSDAVTGDGAASNVETGSGANDLPLSVEAQFATFPDPDLMMLEPLADRGRRFDPAAANDDGATRLFERSQPHTQPNSWLPIIGWATLLVVMIGGIAWMLKKPSADTLLARVEDAKQTGDEKLFEKAIEEFSKFYPDDERVEPLRSELPAKDVLDMVRRLKRRSIVRGDSSNALSAYEQAWLDAVELRTKEPQVAKRRLHAWLAVYDHPVWSEPTQDENTKDERGSLVLLARKELERLEGIPKDALSPEALELQSRLDWGKTELEGESLDQFLQGIKQLYGDKSWAEDLLREIETK
jgi:serine/threonine protein kinase